MTEKVEIYTDGACNGNPGPGGWGVLIQHSNAQKELSGFELDTTNNRMELMAVIQGLEVLTQASEVKLYTDSRYVQEGMKTWIYAWQKNNWKTADKKPVKNLDLWKRLLKVAQKHTVSWKWVRGHSGNPGNERADTLARNSIVKCLMAV